MKTGFRVCGSCTACCKTHPILELKKPPAEWCPHCTVGVGCAIYHERPEGCREFQCQWLLGNGEEKERPDLSKIVVDSMEIPFLGSIIMLFEATEGALSNALTALRTKTALQNNTPVCHLPLKGKNKMYLPSRLAQWVYMVPLINGRECDVILKASV